MSNQDNFDDERQYNSMHSLLQNQPCRVNSITNFSFHEQEQEPYPFHPDEQDLFIYDSLGI